MGSPFTAPVRTGQCDVLQTVQMREPGTEEMDNSSRGIKYRVNFLWRCAYSGTSVTELFSGSYCVIDGPEREQLGYFPGFFTGHLFFLHYWSAFDFSQIIAIKRSKNLLKILSTCYRDFQPEL